MTKLIVADSPKMLRETLCVAQLWVGQSGHAERKTEHMDRLQRLIDETERLRPFGSDGKHNDLHTRTCGCQRPSGILRFARRLTRWARKPR